MKKILINNLLIFFFLTILLLIFLEFLNFKFSGVPIYDKLKIDRNQLTQIKSRSSQINARNAGALTNSEARSMGLNNYRDEMQEE